MSAVSYLVVPERELAALVDGCLAQAGGVQTAAVKLLLKHLQADPRLQAAFVAPHLEDIVRREVRIRCGASTRGKATSMAGKATAAAPRNPAEQLGQESAVEGLVFLARANLEDYLDGYTLSSGTLLGNAGREDLVREMQLRHAGAEEHLLHYSFLRRVLQAAGGSRVRSALSNDQLHRLMADALAEVGR